LTAERFAIRKVLTQIIETRRDAGQKTMPPLRKVVVAAVVANPYAGRYVEDLSEAVEYSPNLGSMLGELAVAALGVSATSYGKAGIAGMAGEQEHAVMFITTPFGDALRQCVGGGAAWISSVTTVAGPGTPLAIPLAHKDALYVREHYDAVTFYPEDAPRPDEIVVAVAVASRGRPNHRLGGLRPEEVVGADGLR